jgi:hypothetical protein
MAGVQGHLKGKAQEEERLEQEMSIEDRLQGLLL